MALSAITKWDVRTTGSALNGGGYSSGGTDYSQQDAAQLSLTDLACLDTTTNLTSATGGFTAAMIGNIVYIASGTQFTVGYYQITAVTDGNTAVIDRTAAVAGQNATVGVGKVGGAVALPSTISAVVVAGNTIYIKSGTYLAQLNCTVAGGQYTVIKWIGFKTTHGDSCVGTDRPLFDSESTRAEGITVLVINNNLYNLQATRSTASGFYLNQGNALRSVILSNCKAYLNTAAGFNGSTTSNVHYINCEASTNSTVGFLEGADGTGGRLWCYSHNNTTNGFTRCSNYLYCIAESNGATGFTAARGNYNIGNIIGNIAYGNTGATTDGFYLYQVGSDQSHWITINNISQANGRYGFNTVNAGLSNLFDFNSYQGNGTAGLLNVTAGTNDTTADPLFTNPAADPPDFSLQTGSPCKDKGFPDANWAVNVGLASARY